LGRIQTLAPHVADLIAAGEVVERPASVVKELMENAIDAGASQITVEIQNGGMTLIRVSDNGSGIPREDAPLAFLRHATSKLQTAQDLEAIETLGFRGEALAAIAAVSRIELLSCTAEEALGCSLLLEGGTLRSQEEIGCPPGTTMVVRDLFFNTPARLKFMKRDAAEGAAVFSIIQRIALAHPQISIKFIRDGKQELLTPGDHQLSSALYSVFGRDLALGFTKVQGSGEDAVTVHGFVSMPTCCRGTRAYQHFILNGRPIRSRLLTAAVEEAYQNQKMVGKFPGCVLHVDLKPSTVDVNVHPAKTEVKFLSEKKIFDAVYYTVLSALGEERRHPNLQMEKPRPTPLHPSVTTPLAVATPQFRDSMSPPSPQISKTEAPRVEPLYEPTVIKLPRVEPSLLPEVGRGLTKEPPLPKVEQEMKAPPPLPSELSREMVEEPIPTIGEAAPSYRISGEVFDTYLVVEQEEQITFIDKHAAHERLHFDRMKAEGYRPMAQSLLEPVVLTLPPEEGEVLRRHLSLLEAYGFLVEDFGGGSLVLRQVPFDLDPGEAEGVLEGLARALLSGNRLDPTAARDHLLHSMACKAAIKGGQKTKALELGSLVEAVLSGEVKYCPHGRPVAITLTRAQLERQFGRA